MGNDCSNCNQCDNTDNKKMEIYKSDKQHRMEEYIEEHDYPKDQQTDQERTRKEGYRYENGAVYSGEWLNGMKDGQGEQIWPDGARYEGQWKQNKADGEG